MKLSQIYGVWLTVRELEVEQSSYQIHRARYSDLDSMLKTLFVSGYHDEC